MPDKALRQALMDQMGKALRTPDADNVHDAMQPRQGARLPGNRQTLDTSGGPMEVPTHAPMFMADPIVRGGPGFARDVEQVLRFNPEAKGTTRSITHGVTEGAAELLAKSKFEPERYSGTNLGGVTDHGRSNDISVNPRREPGERDMTLTLAHELTHAAGRSDKAAYPAGEDAARARHGKTSAMDDLDAAWDRLVESRGLKKQANGDYTLPLPKMGSK